MTKAGRGPASAAIEEALERGGDIVQCRISGAHDFAHQKKSMNLIGDVPMLHGDGRLPKALGIGDTFIAQRIIAGGQYIGRRQTRQICGAQR